MYTYALLWDRELNETCIITCGKPINSIFVSIITSINIMKEDIDLDPNFQKIEFCLWDYWKFRGNYIAIYEQIIRE